MTAMTLLQPCDTQQRSEAASSCSEAAHSSGTSENAQHFGCSAANDAAGAVSGQVMRNNPTQSAGAMSSAIVARINVMLWARRLIVNRR